MKKQKGVTIEFAIAIFIIFSFIDILLQYFNINASREIGIFLIGIGYGIFLERYFTNKNKTKKNGN